VKEVTIGRARLILGDAAEVLPTIGKVAHIITDPPYSERTHSGHDQVALQVRRDGAERLALGYTALSRDGAERLALGYTALSRDGAERLALGYTALSRDGAERLAETFAAASDGWIVWMTDHTLAPTIAGKLESIGRYVFAPLPYFHAGRSVRLAGDGPSSWTDWLVVSRTKAQSKWGTLRGGYVAGPGWDDKVRMGGKPTRLMRLVVTDYSRPGELVCDPFMGAGTTGVACMMEDRDFVGIEIDEATFDIACKRIEDAQRQADLFIAGAA